MTPSPSPNFPRPDNDSGGGPDRKPPFDLGPVGWLLLTVSVIIAAALAARQQDWSEAHMPASIGFITGTAVGTIGLVLLPPWLVWLFSKQPRRGYLILFYCLLGLSTLGRLMTMEKSSQITPEFANDIRQSMKDGLKQADKGNLEESAKPMLQALDKQAASGGSNAVEAGIMTQFLHELQQQTAVVDAATKAARNVPAPTDADPASYDRKIAADADALKSIRDEISFIQNIPKRIETIIKSKNQPDLENDEMLLGFKKGLTENQPLLLDYYGAMQTSFQTGSEVFTLLKANQGHWHLEQNGHRVLEDAAVQKQYDAAVAANAAANVQLAADKNKLIESQKQTLQKSF